MSDNMKKPKSCGATCPGCKSGHCNKEKHHDSMHHCTSCDHYWRNWTVTVIITGIIAVILGIISMGAKGKLVDDRCKKGCTYPVGNGRTCGQPCAKPAKGYHLGHRCSAHLLKGV